MKTLMMIITIFGSAIVSRAQDIIRTPTSQNAAHVVSDFLNAYQQKDHAKLESLLHPEVVWIQPGDNRISGIKKSREEVFVMGKQMSELSDKTITLADVKILNATGNSVACVLRWKAAQPPGTVLDIENVDVFTIENDKIISVKVYSMNLSEENRFWGSN